MEIDLDVSALERAACAYGAARDAFSSEKDTLAKCSLGLAQGWSSEGYLAFQRESAYILSDSFGPGCEALGKVAKTLGEAASEARPLLGRASGAASALGGAAPEPPRLRYSSWSADVARQYAGFAVDDLDAIGRGVSSAVSGVILETTSCDLDEGSLWAILGERRSRAEDASSRLSDFEAGLSSLLAALSAPSAAPQAAPGLVVGGVASLYSDGVLNVDLVRELMLRPPGLVSPSEMAALASALEAIMGEAVAAGDAPDEGKLAVLAQFLEACYGLDEVDASLSFWMPEGKYAIRSDLSPNFGILAKRVSSSCGEGASAERRTLSLWLDGVVYSASSVYRVAEDIVGGLSVGAPEKGVSLRFSGDGQSIETYFDNCASGRTYALGASSSYFETDRDLRFVVSRPGNSAKQTYSDFAEADVFSDSSGQNPDLDAQITDYFRDTVDLGGAAAEMLVTKSVTGSPPMPSALDFSAAACFAFQAVEASSMNELREEASKSLEKDLIGKRDESSGSEGVDARLNADGTVTVYDRG